MDTWKAIFWMVNIYVELSDCCCTCYFFIYTTIAFQTGNSSVVLWIKKKNFEIIKLPQTNSKFQCWQKKKRRVLLTYSNSKWSRLRAIYKEKLSFAKTTNKHLYKRKALKIVTGSVAITQLELIFPLLDWHIKNSTENIIALKLQIMKSLFEVNFSEII